jgi:hypothetical protein
MRVYISGPMRHIRNFNYPLFNRVARTLRKYGFSVFNPAETKEKLTFRGYMQIDLPEVMRADLIVMLPGWRKSVGAKLEHQTAVACDIPVIEWKDAA